MCQGFDCSNCSAIWLHRWRFRYESQTQCVWVWVLPFIVCEHKFSCFCVEWWCNRTLSAGPRLVTWRTTTTAARWKETSCARRPAVIHDVGVFNMYIRVLTSAGCAHCRTMSFGRMTIDHRVKNNSTQCDAIYWPCAALFSLFYGFLLRPVVFNCLNTHQNASCSLILDNCCWIVWQSNAPRVYSHSNVTCKPDSCKPTVEP